MTRTKAKAESFGFEVYGVALRVFSRDAEVLRELKRRLIESFPADSWRELRSARSCRRYSIRRNARASFVMFDGRTKITEGNDAGIFLNFVTSRIRLHVAEFSPRFVFVHAGVVEWNGRAIILPAKSFSGKTSLVRELVGLGARYYSDEYAVIGEDGLVRPFATPLGVRTGGKWSQTSLPPEAIGEVGRDPIPVGMVLHTAFEPDGEFAPEEVSRGEGILEMLSQTIPMTYRPEFSLKLLNLATSRAIILKSKRGEATRAAQKILKLLE